MDQAAYRGVWRWIVRLTAGSHMPDDEVTPVC